MIKNSNAANSIIGKTIKDVSLHQRKGDFISLCLMFDDDSTLRVDPMEGKTLWVSPNDPSSPTPPSEASDCQQEVDGGVGCSAWLGRFASCSESVIKTTEALRQAHKQMHGDCRKGSMNPLCFFRRWAYRIQHQIYWRLPLKLSGFWGRTVKGLK